MSTLIHSRSSPLVLKFTFLPALHFCLFRAVERQCAATTATALLSGRRSLSVHEGEGPLIRPSYSRMNMIPLMSVVHDANQNETFLHRHAPPLSMKAIEAALLLSIPTTHGTPSSTVTLTECSRAQYYPRQSHYCRPSNMAPARRGAFIVLEGLDRSGKSTQCLKLVDNLNKAGLKAKGIRFPGE